MGHNRTNKNSENPKAAIIGEQQHRIGIEFNTSFGSSQRLRTQRLLDQIQLSKLLKNDRAINNLQHSGNVILTDIRFNK